MVKNLLANAGARRDMGPGWGRAPGAGNGNPLHDSCLDNSMVRSLGGYNPWGLKESDMTEHRTTGKIHWVLHLLQKSVKAQAEGAGSGLCVPEGKPLLSSREQVFF